MLVMRADKESKRKHNCVVIRKTCNPYKDKTVKSIVQALYDSGEVYMHNIESRIERTKFIIEACIGSNTMGIVACKKPYMSYRRRIEEQTGMIIKKFPLEMGWLWVRKDHRKGFVGLCLVRKCIKEMPSNFFITVREDNKNLSHKILVGLGFSLQGRMNCNHVVCVYTYTKEK